MLCHFVTLCDSLHHKHRTDNFLHSYWDAAQYRCRHLSEAVCFNASRYDEGWRRLDTAALRRRRPQTPFNPMKSTYHCQNSHTWLYLLPVPAGYGFVDFDSPASAQKAVTALKAGGVQAQMAKVRSACLTFSMSVGFDSRRHSRVRSHRWM